MSDIADSDLRDIAWDRPGAIEQAVAARIERLTERHDPASDEFRSQLLACCAALLEQGRRHAERRLLEDRRGLACARFLAQLTDEMIAAFFRLARRIHDPEGNAAGDIPSVLAVGGYGRGALAPGSDIDLLFLLPDKSGGHHKRITEFILYMLWDLKLKVGHASRTISEALSLAKEDATILTATLEARYICGDERLYAELARRFRDEITSRDPAAFIATKLAERDARHARYGESRYLVEPDVKEGKGGLRDLHTLFWIGKYVYGVQEVSGLVAHGLFSHAELRRFLKAEDFFWAVRCHMHFLTGRAIDKLSFDLQPQVAERLGYVASRGLKHVERFMRHYFLIAKEVGDLTRIFCAVLEERHLKKPPRLTRMLRGVLGRTPRRQQTEHPDFVIDNGRLAIAAKDAFVRDPANLLRLFVLADAHDAGIHPQTLSRVRRSLKLIDDTLREDPEANRLFLHLLCASHDPESALRKLNEAGVLGRFIPDFGRIVALMQFNMYHHYTVDEHLIRTVGWLARIDRGELKDEHPLSTEIFAEIINRRALYVAAFLHDIAKGRPESHSVAGAKVAAALCPRLGLSEAETETVVWLVRHHLLMSETSQMRDLSDFKTILDFAGQVQSPERLKLLVILTVVDIRAVGPGVWNGWKGQLLRTLYQETEPVLSGGHASRSLQARVKEAQERFRRAIDWPREKTQRYLAMHYAPYWLTTAPDIQLRHARFIDAARARGEKIAIDIHSDAFTAITDVTVYTPDHPHLLALLTGACAAAGANIVGARIFTTADGWALDTILLQRAFDDDADEARRAERVADTIRKTLRGELRPAELVARARRPRDRAQAFEVTPQVIINNKSSNRFSIIEVAGKDRIGLLHDLTTALHALNLNIVSAHVATYGERAVDVFYVTDLTGAKITAEARRRAIVETLTKVLEDDAAAAEAS